MKPAILLLVPALALALLPAHASPVNLQAFTLVVPCADPDGVSSAEVGDATLAAGLYVVTVSGFCDYSAESITLDTPCQTPAGHVPCVDGDLQNVPMGQCSHSFGVIHKWGCPVADYEVDCPTPGAYDDLFLVKVNGQCIDKGVGLLEVPQGYVHARFVDWRYEDNVGVLLVTFTWTPLNA